MKIQEQLRLAFDDFAALTNDAASNALKLYFRPLVSLVRWWRHRQVRSITRVLASGHEGAPTSLEKEFLLIAMRGVLRHTWTATAAMHRDRALIEELISREGNGDLRKLRQGLESLRSRSLHDPFRSGRGGLRGLSRKGIDKQLLLFSREQVFASETNARLARILADAWRLHHSGLIGEAAIWEGRSLDPFDHADHYGEFLAEHRGRITLVDDDPC